MGITVTELITEAYYDSSVVALRFETLQGYQLTDGLKWLNQILDDKTMDNGDIPYITQQYPLNAVPGQETYFIPNCISIDAITFYVSGNELGYNANNATPLPNSNPMVRYQMNYVDRNRYFGQPRAENINALPVSYTYERVQGGIKLWVYFPPQSNYLFHITGNFFMQNVTLNQDLTAQIATANLGAAYVTGAVGNLGVCTILGTGVLAAGEVVVNGIDLAGTYTSSLQFVNYINTGVITGVTAALVSNYVILSSATVSNTVTTLGTVGVNGLTFSNFSTTSGAASLSFSLGAVIEVGGLVINGVDLAGAYATPNTLVNYINTGIVPNVIASYDNFQFTLTSTLNTNILVVTDGAQSSTNNVSFEYFSTIGTIPLNQTYLPMGLDGFYTNYLEYQLAERICSKLNFGMPEEAATQLNRYRLNITSMAEPLDLTQQKVSCLGDVRGINYAAANIGRGYTVSGY